MKSLPSHVRRLLQGGAVAFALLFATQAASAAVPTNVPGPTNQMAYIATILVPTQAYTSPGSSRVAAHLSTQAKIAGGSNTLLVLGSANVGGTEYLKLRLPERPDGNSGWVNINDLFVQADPYRVVVSIGARSVTIYKGGRRSSSTRAVVGAVGTPTPLGLFAISEDVLQPSGSNLGAYVITLTAHSNFLKTFDGGDGTVGIHGYELLGASLGTRSSHGCVRVPESFVYQVLHLPEGTPVIIQN